MIVCLLRTWGVWFLAVQLVKAEVSLENGAYRNIVVSFSSELPSDEGENIVKRTKELLEKTSSVLQQTLGVSIGQVTFALPDNWEVPGHDPGSIPRVEPDILVDKKEGSPFGKGPFAEQFGGCGVRGTHIDVPYSFLTSEEETYPKEKLLAREWLKFRYGVFDEHGFPGDPKYPDHYIIHGDEEHVKITECTDPALEYLIKNSNNETCTLGEENCKVHLGDGADEVKSSLMYLHEELKNVDKVCGKEHQHNFISPSKQNILCSEKSIWEVLNESGEFKDVVPTESTAIEYQFVKFSKPKLLILLEATSPLKSKKAEITFALQRVVFDLPEGTHFGLKTFIPSETKVVRPMSELGSDRSLLIQATFEAPSDDVCPLCILEESVDVLPKNEPGIVILITASNSSSTSDNSALLEKLKNSHLFLLLITITEDGVSLDSYSDLLKELTHLNKAYLSEIKSSEIELFKALYTDILTHFPFSPADPSTEIVNNGIISQGESIEIPKNQLTETVTIWVDKDLDKGQLVCKNENIEVNLTKIEEGFLKRLTYKAEGLVSCKLIYGEKTMVQVTKPSESEYFISASTWVHDTTTSPTEGLQQADSGVQMPVIIYAKINYGGYPVSLANVEAVVKDDEGKEAEKVSLKDDGKGDPDITMGDGIYSGYFFEFSKEGSYNVKVQMKTDASQAKAIKTGNDRCCGTQVEPKVPHEESTISVVAFEKTASTVFSAISGKPENGYPPAKILDLRVKKFEPPSLLELTWTAPGGEVDKGKANRYTLKSFTNRKEALENFDTAGKELSISQDPSISGTIEVLSLKLDDLLDDNMTHYLVLRAEGKTPGQPSNVVTVSVPEAVPPTEPPQPTEESHKQASGPDKTTIAIIIGVLVGVIVISICLYLAILCIGKRKKRAKEERRKAEEGSAGAVRNGGGMGMNSIPADVILKHHSEVVRAKRDHKDPPIFKEEDAAAAKPSDEASASGYSQVQKDQPPELPVTLPPKSPKRMTNV